MPSCEADSARLAKELITAKKVAFRWGGAELAIHASIGTIETWPSGDSSAVLTMAMKRASTTPPLSAAVQWCRPWYMPRVGSASSVVARVRKTTMAAIERSAMKRRNRNRPSRVRLLAISGPLLISVVVRTLGWVILMGNNGLVNRGLDALGIGWIPFNYTETGVIIALVHVMIPFMIITVWAVLQKVDPATENAAASLGASQLRVFFRVVVPQVIPGILSGSLIVFSLTTSAFATPSIIGGRRLKVASTTIYDEFLNTLEWPLGAAIAMILLLGIMAIILGWNRLIERRYAQVFQ